MVRAFFLGFIQIHILHHAVQEPIFGAAMIAELKRHGYDLSSGTLYLVLYTLEKSGIFECEYPSGQKQSMDEL